MDERLGSRRQARCENRESAHFKRDYDVIVVGAGPTGLTVANILARLGITVALFERHSSPYNLPRAGHIDEEVLRILQGIGCLPEILAESYQIQSVPLLDAKGEFLLDLVRAHESPSSFVSVMMYQPLLEDSLYGQLRKLHDVVRIFQGWTVVEVEQGVSSVCIEARPANGVAADAKPAESFTAKFLIAADGAASSIRRMIGIAREDFGFNERWMDIDVAYLRPCDFGPPAIFGDPKRPRFISPLGKSHHRFECQLFKHESAEEFSTPRRAWEFLRENGATPEDVEIVRHAVYTFEYRLAQRWRERRVLLMGDAAHTISPLLGQGMSSGMRDAINLGWKLDLVLRGVAHSSILDTYEVERRPHLQAWADLSLMAGEFICLTDPEQAAARDARIRRGEVPAWRPPPTLTTGIFALSADEAGVAGRLLPQHGVRLNGIQGLFDDVVDNQFLLLTLSDPETLLTAEDREFMDRIDMRSLRFSEDHRDTYCIADPTGAYQSFFANRHLQALVVRPDRYMFGGAQAPENSTTLLGYLRRALELC